MSSNENPFIPGQVLLASIDGLKARIGELIKELQEVQAAGPKKTGEEMKADNRRLRQKFVPILQELEFKKGQLQEQIKTITGELREKEEEEGILAGLQMFIELGKETLARPGQVPLASLEQLLIELHDINVHLKEARANLAKKQEDRSGDSRCQQQQQQLVQSVTATPYQTQAEVGVESAQAQTRADPLPVKDLTERLNQARKTVSGTLNKIQDNLHASRRQFLLRQVRPTALDDVQTPVEHTGGKGAQDDNSQVTTLHVQENDVARTLVKVDEMVKVVQNSLTGMIALLDDLNTRGVLENKDDMAELTALLNALKAGGAAESKGDKEDVAGDALRIHGHNETIAGNEGPFVHLPNALVIQHLDNFSYRLLPTMAETPVGPDQDPLDHARKYLVKLRSFQVELKAAWSFLDEALEEEEWSTTTTREEVDAEVDRRVQAQLQAHSLAPAPTDPQQVVTDVTEEVQQTRGALRATVAKLEENIREFRRVLAQKSLGQAYADAGDVRDTWASFQAMIRNRRKKAEMKALLEEFEDLVKLAQQAIAELTGLLEDINAGRGAVEDKDNKDDVSGDA
ncbi:hypothetical protein BGX29_007409 [Mortierella sp. GBA35]|nr:hypothetical protein BGX29_007409 [Mortierella sp. GBA35]